MRNRCILLLSHQDFLDLHPAYLGDHQLQVAKPHLLPLFGDMTDEAEQEAGYHSVQWDASDLASGIYFYRLTASSFTDTKRMVLMK